MRSTSLARTRAFAVLLSLAATVVAAGGACDKSRNASPSSPAGAAAFADSPFLPFIPADTPYVLATFKGVPATYWAKFGPMMKAMANPAVIQAQPEGEGRDLLLAFVEEMGPNFDAKRAKELGLNPDARMAIYGLGLYPVWRIEVEDGSRLFATVERIATRAKKTLDKPTEQGGYRLWQFPSADGPTVVVGVGARDAVFSVMPAADIAAAIPRILGTEKPAKSLPIEVLADLAKRHGFSAYGAGFVDSARLAALVIPAETAAACKAAILDLTTRAPRLAFGYGDLTQPVLEFGMVLELAPDLLTEMKGIAIKTPGVHTVVASEPLFAMAVAADINKARSLAGRAGQAMTALSTSCPDEDLTEFAKGLGDIAIAPLPPALTGIKGGVISIKDVTMVPGQAPTALDGFAAIWADDAPSLMAVLSGLAPPLANLNLKPDGTPREILGGMLPFPVFAALQKNGITVSAGTQGGKDAAASLTAKAETAPLLLLHYDYGRFFKFVADMTPAGDPAAAQTTAMMRDMSKTFGPATLELLVDDRGAVFWGKMTMR